MAQGTRAISLLKMIIRIGRSIVSHRELLAVLGATLVLLTLSLDFTFSNLSTYVISYLRKTNPKISSADWIYVTMVRTFIQSFLMPFTGSLEKRIGSRMSILIGSVIYSTSILCTYFLLDYGLVPIIFSLSISHGIGFSLMYAQAIGSVIKWFLTGNKGLMASIAIGGYGFGAVILIPIQTAFVNPHNVQAMPVSNETNAEKYFVDENLLHRVPYLFLLLGGVFGVFQIIGLFLLAPPKHNYLEESLSLSTNESVNNTKDRSIRETVSTWQFWMLWTFMAMIQLCASFVYTYQKSYGIKFINDDAFFSLVGALSNILNGCSRIVWGKMYDWKGFRMNAFIVGAVTTISSVSFVALNVFSEDQIIAKKIVFCLLSILFYGFYPGIYTLIAPTIQNTFGHLNYARDYGLIFTQSMFGGSIILLITTFLFDYLNFEGMFLLSGVFGILGLAAVWKFNET